MMLKPVGFFAELGTTASYSGSIRDAVRDRPGDHEPGLISYLTHGYVVLDVPETPADVIVGNQSIVGAPSLVTDATWLWRLDLAYYLQNYHLKLPSQFVRHALRLDFRVPSLSRVELEAATAEALRFF